MSLLSEKPPKSEKSTGKNVSRSHKAGLIFPVGRLHRQLKDGRYSKKTGVTAAVYSAAVLEYLIAELVELAGVCAKKEEKVRIVPRHLMMAIRGDAEMNHLLKKAVLPDAGIMPTVDLVKRSKKTVQDEPSQVV